jgi:hypothetical protein
MICHIKISANETKIYKHPKQHKTSFGEEYGTFLIKESNINRSAYGMKAKLTKVN